MKIVMTVMVRNEADVIRAMLEHHRSQGVDLVIATDNGSTDGTVDILEEYAATGFLVLEHDPQHRKQQSEVVTAMARRAGREYNADWVINADADEFWVAADSTRTVRDILEETPTEFGSFIVPVIDMTGPPARRGSGFDRLVFRDTRPVERLEEIGLLAHSTPDAIHVGDADVTVAQGNHSVSIQSRGTPSQAKSLEVLHLPWRSWAQFSQKVEQAGRAYAANPDKTPSPNHHGLRDYRRLQDGTLLGHYLARHPDASEIEEGSLTGTLVRDERLVPLASLGTPDEPFEEAEALTALERAKSSLALEARALHAERLARENARAAALAQAELAQLAAENARIAIENEHLAAVVEQYRSRRAVRMVDAVSRATRRAR